MSILSVFHRTTPDLAQKVLTHHDDIRATLAEQGIDFSHEPHDLRIRPGSVFGQLPEAAGAWLDGLMSRRGCSAFVLVDEDGRGGDGVDIAVSHDDSRSAGAPEQAVAAARGLRAEHTHAAHEAFAVISGRAQVALSVGEHVFAVLCEKGDVLSIPAGTGRWIDLGDNPFCLAVRAFEHQDGSAPQFTGDESVTQFPGMSEL